MPTQDTLRKAAKRSNRTKGARAIDRLVALMASGKIALGESLSERALAHELGMSRTPVRQAIQRLTEMGLLVPQQGSGTHVRPLEFDEYRQVMEIRAALEAMAGRLAAPRISEAALDELSRLGKDLDDNWPEPTMPNIGDLDLRFHRLIAESSGNPRLCRLLDDQSLLQTCFRLQKTISKHFPPPTINLAGHSRIVESLRKRSADEADKIIRRHIMGSIVNMLEQEDLKRQPIGPVR